MPLILPLTKGHLSDKGRIQWRSQLVVEVEAAPLWEGGLGGFSPQKIFTS